VPEKQVLLKLDPSMTAHEAIRLLEKHGYSQAPVVYKGEVLGIFSYKSFAMKVAEITFKEIGHQGCAPSDIPIEECLEKFDYLRISEEITKAFSSLNRDDGVLIGTPELLQGILTPIDFLNYLYRQASPFLLLSEIEMALRALIGRAVSPKELEECAIISLSHLYKDTDRRVPTTLEEMTFDNYRMLITHGGSWPKFEKTFGGNKTRTSAKLKELGELRNDVFHFKRQITPEDVETLNVHRDWLLMKAIQADLSR
jgi:CBS domain-containing protein